MSIPSIAVVIPAYRAETSIAAVLEGIPDFVRHVVVVDDASPDRTGEIAAASTDPRVKVVVQSENQGVGGATLRGYDEAIALGAEIVAKMDSDGQMDPRELWSIVTPIVDGRADYAKGNRFLHWPELTAMPLRRRIGNAGLSFLTKAASGYWNVFDPSNGYTAIHAAVIPLLDRRKIDPRFFFESSLLIELGVARAVVADVPIPARYGGESSSLSEWNVLATFPRKLLRGLLRRWTIHY
ncbi:MAG: glycosyltransferase family 2 protein, partial [Candidatus Binatia bacterium]